MDKIHIEGMKFLELNLLHHIFSGGNYDNYPSLIRQNALNNNIENPRLPPYPHATQIYPLSQIKQPLMLATSIGGKTQSPTHTPSGKDNVVVVNACFSTPRLWIGGNPSVSVEHRGRLPNYYVRVQVFEPIYQFLNSISVLQKKLL